MMTNRHAGFLLCGLVLLAVCARNGKVLAAELPTPDHAALKYEEPKYLTGSIYGKGADSKRLLFKFKREATRSGEKLTAQRDYTYPDGRPAAQERLVYDGNNLVSVELKELQTGAAGTARIHHAPGNPAKGSIHFEYTKEPGGKPKTGTEPLTDNTLVNDMVAPFLASHWDALLRGEKLKCRYIVVPRRETVGFTFGKDSESAWQGRDVIIVKMEPTSAIISALLDPVFFTIEKAPPHRVLEYVGRTTPKIQSGGKWKDLDAVTVFDWESAR